MTGEVSHCRGNILRGVATNNGGVIARPLVLT